MLNIFRFLREIKFQKKKNRQVCHLEIERSTNKQTRKLFTQEIEKEKKFLSFSLSSCQVHDLLLTNFNVGHYYRKTLSFSLFNYSESE